MAGATDGRGVSSVIGTILLVAVVVLLAVTVTIFALGFTERTTEVGPTIGESTGTLESNGAGSDNGFVRITHLAGDTVSVSDLEIAVDATAACGKRGRLVELPADTRTGIDPSNVEGDNLFDGSPPQFVGGTNALHESALSAGETLQFRIPNSKCSVAEGEEVVVSLVHVPTNTVLVEETVRATAQ